MKIKRLLIVSWFIATLLGVALLTIYKHTKANTHYEKISDWPLLSALGKVETKPQLLLFLHPKCVCSFASLSEFAKLAHVLSNKAEVKIIFVRPQNMDEGVLKGDLWIQAKKISQAQLIIDQDGFEHKKFGVTTSGETLLFSEKGEKIFHGGITPSRGHVGESKGQAFIRSWFKGNFKSRDISSVYGCGLEGKKNEKRK